MEAFALSWAPRLLSVLRFMSGLLLLQHGTRKLLHFPNAMPNPSYSGVLELIGGALLVVGLLTRTTAFILSGFCAVAYFMAHAPRGFYPALNGGELAALYCFVFLFIATHGGGKFAVQKS